MPIDRLPRQGYGYGIIRLSFRLTEHIAPLAQIKLTDVQGELQERGAFEQVKQGLLLPDNYTIMGIYLEAWRMTWCVLVEAPGLPAPEQGSELPSVDPVYQIQTPSRERVLLELRVVKSNHVLRID